jgi:glycerophosphoryl diester phosphodiesterase
MTIMLPMLRWTRARLALASSAVLVASSWAGVLVARRAAGFPRTPPSAYLSALAAPVAIAHRGASGTLLEHTLAAYDRALADGAQVLELDLRATADDQLVVVHDASLARTHGVDRAVAALTRADIDELLGARAPPSLGAVFAAYPGRAMNLELKDERPEVAGVLAAALAAAGRETSVMVASFHGEVLARFRALTRGRVATSASPGEALRFYLCFLIDVPCRVDYQALQLPRRALGLALDDPALIAFAHRHGLVVHYWTVDDAEAMARLIAAGADGIMTNHPERAARAIAAQRLGPVAR